MGNGDQIHFKSVFLWVFFLVCFFSPIFPSNSCAWSYFISEAFILLESARFRKQRQAVLVFCLNVCGVGERWVLSKA